jgi:vancomycin resistance protein VanJ
VIPTLLSGGAWLLAGTVLAGLGLRPALGDELFVTRYTAYTMPWLLVVLLPAAWWACRARRRALAPLLATAAAVIVGIHLPLFVPRGAVSAPAAVTLKVMSFNTWSRNHDAPRIAGAIRSAAADLVLLQEIPPPVFERLREVLQDHYGGAAHWAYEAEIQQGVLSRHPIEPRAALAGKGRAQRVVVHSPGGPIEVFNVHPLRTGGWRHRYRQIGALLEEHVLQERSPVIVAGDLNASDHSQLYALVAGRLRNAHEAAGFGFGFTYPAAVHVLAAWRALPMARIDHVFFSDHFVALRAGTLEDAAGSDHRPVFAELALGARPAAPPEAPHAPPRARVGSRVGPAPPALPRAGLATTTLRDRRRVRGRTRRAELRAGGGAAGVRCTDCPQLRSPAPAETRPRTKAPGA